MHFLSLYNWYRSITVFENLLKVDLEMVFLLDGVSFSIDLTNGANCSMMVSYLSIII